MYTIHPDIELGEVKLKVSHLARSLRFYQDVVGLTVLTQNATTAELTADGSTPLVIIEEIPDAVIVPPRSVSGLYHFAILLPTRKALGVSLRRLIDSGISIGQADHLVSEALYISDPDHNGIEIYADRSREDWEKDAEGNYKMTTDPIDWEGLLEEARGEEWTGLPAGTRIGHVHFHVSDLLQAQSFYCGILGFDVAANYMSQMRALFISAGGYHHHVGLNLWAGIGAPAAPANGTGLAYWTIVYPGAVELTNALEQLHQAGIPVEQQADAWHVTDPFGIRLKLSTN
ncbi:VOC family protein [Paenibacillus sp. J2TS4]|uniref:VOC family protein n=1 Tax=Paenibacillus sp. J2TS4 TaxID=2807194 RepID=UPI001B2658C1|nr:VOC family protein [Paenibacillus sp. J2TS4]GIP31530.1 catechol-2,3-dioxygenase [Paenibacillus sp. J2TS4]